MIIGQHEIILASPPDREKLVAEISVGNEMWGEINHESDKFEIELYPRRDGEPWRFSLDEMLAALDAAIKRLSGRLP
jgi:hypothetical protein